MPFRNQEIAQLCGVCKEPASARCRRCHLPLCDQHKLARNQRCKDCESYFEENAPTELTVPREAARKGTAMLALLPATIFVWAMALGAGMVGNTMGGLWLAVVLFGGAYLGGSILVHRAYEGSLEPEAVLKRARKRWRRKFLRERKQRALPAAPTGP